MLFRSRGGWRPGVVGSTWRQRRPPDRRPAVRAADDRTRPNRSTWCRRALDEMDTSSSGLNDPKWRRRRASGVDRRAARRRLGRSQSHQRSCRLDLRDQQRRMQAAVGRAILRSSAGRVSVADYTQRHEPEVPNVVSTAVSGPIHLRSDRPVRSGGSRCGAPGRAMRCRSSGLLVGVRRRVGRRGPERTRPRSRRE